LNTKYLIAAVVVIVLIASAAFVYIYYQGQPSSEELEALQNLVDDHGYKTSLTAYPEKNYFDCAELHRNPICNRCR
jgi:CDP-diacylglycerol pyrophosphatase